MNFVQRLAVAAVVLAGLGFSHESSATPSTPFSNPGFGLLVSELQTFRSTTFTDNASPQAIAIDKALLNFADDSTTYAEDIKDFAKALKALRPVFTGDPTVGGSLENRVYSFYAGPLVIYLQLAGILNAANPNINAFAKLKMIAKLDATNKITNEQKRLKKFFALMNSYQAQAKKHHVNLYVPQ